MSALESNQIVISAAIPAPVVSLYHAIACNKNNNNHHHIVKLFKRLDRLNISFKTQNEIIDRAINKSGLNNMFIQYLDFKVVL